MRNIGSERAREMSKLTVEKIRQRFEFSNDFNEIFDAFEQALKLRLDDIELYQRLFWNDSLKPDELCLFGEQLTKEFPKLAYDTYMFLANVFETMYSMIDNHELSFLYYRKAASVRPESSEPYMHAADSYEADLNIPNISSVIAFLKAGIQHAAAPKIFYERLVQLYEINGNDEMRNYYRRLADEDSLGKKEPPQH